ncbi:MAG: carbohydrate kinase family protein [Atopobiaceae bacterium]|jgi:sugar/nucleoside kinase (ribokinase family)|nr:carbohydrate kinase family protein [Atopobiaceae bacterium]MCH4119121.1 carbohydrate kinase family protein [Atopobiaceae bacterium]MCI1318116.1 carbohydrate kinase family protein [Atopobiaceae bacterium]MCI1388620.1 carbohydrate kinase family protein [Atopobiaceae bacterium]MCI1432119.1 carbohydrate kinase family protein [Atopobiaceae bacterium]
MAGKTCEVACVGQAVLDCISQGVEGDLGNDRYCTAREVRLSTGGDACNEAFVLAGLGRATRLVCGLGDDLAGEAILAKARSLGIDVSQATVSGSLTTPVAPLLLRTDADRTAVSSDAAMLEGYEPSADTIAGARVVSLASLGRAPLSDPAAIRRLVSAAHEQGSVVCADTKSPNFRRLSFEEIGDVLPLLDYIFPNDREAILYTGCDDVREAARWLRGKGVRNVVVKCGADGVWADGEQGSFALPALPVDVVDTTGAGDNFVAGFISTLLDGGDLRSCCEAGRAQATKTVARVGATQA